MRTVFLANMVVAGIVVACGASSGNMETGGAGTETAARKTDATPVGELPGEMDYPIQITSSAGNVPYPWFKGLDRVVSSAVSLLKGEVPSLDAHAKDTWWYVDAPVAPDAFHWIARVRVLDGPIPIVRDEPSAYPVGQHFQFWIWREWRYYKVQVVEVLFGKPLRGEYQLWDLGGDCPGDFQYCPPGAKNAEECLRIKGEFLSSSWACEYRHPETGELLVHLGELDAPSGLQAGAEFFLFGADAIEGLTENGLWAMLKGIGADPATSTLTGYQRLLYRTQGDQVDVIFLSGEDFPGSPGGYMGYAGPRWIPQRFLARRVLDRIVMPYLDAHPEDKPSVEAALAGLLLEEYLHPTPEEPEEPAMTSCPEDPVAAAGSSCNGSFTCRAGEVTCCGEVYSRRNCWCNKYGSLTNVLECAEVNESSCFGGACPPQSCLVDEECPAGFRCVPVFHAPLGAARYLCVPAA